MFELTPGNTAEYLRQHGWLQQAAGARVAPLAWGVSNVVMRVTPDPETGAADFVIKQSRGQLRTAAPWFSRLDRIFREIDVLRVLHKLLPSGAVPAVLFEDRENYMFGMEAAPADHIVWKQQLLDRVADASVAEQLGRLLARVHSATAGRDDLRQEFGDTEVFHQLRLQPFYETLAEKFPASASDLTQLVEESRQSFHCLVLADFSPKNVLLTGFRRVDPANATASRTGIMLVDFETGHFGDPAFDLGFFLSHLLLKLIRHSPKVWEPYSRLTHVFLNNYWFGMSEAGVSGLLARPDLERRMWRHLAGCMWARIDGTSPVDYLPEPELRQLVRDFCRNLFESPPADWTQLLHRLQNEPSIACESPAAKRVVRQS